ncbi:trefoil factor 2-like [Lepisosteus oculatus]|uniref:trefoil factor 2-like n=1 Tax=Lepisosteus oculatus TaxID=7918 RepID=UPI00074027C2|nr:PREDICTED: trefoil factor 2-like [Lepisosteus oculatus]
MHLSLLLFLLLNGLLAFGDDQLCSVNPKEREECGYPGITAEECNNRGCCFSSAIPNVKWCFKPNESVCAVGSAERKNCGYAGISEAECISRGCCFNSSVRGVIWCFFRKEPTC